MTIPGGQVTISEARIYQAKGRIGMGYNAATTIYDCADVLNYDVEVKVKMAAKTLHDTNGRPTGEVHYPEPPYKRTTLRKELTKITFNGQRVFHAAVITRTGVDNGMSQVVVPYDPNNPTCQGLQKFAKHTLANLACFFYHWWHKIAGYHESTIK